MDQGAGAPDARPRRLLSLRLVAFGCLVAAVVLLALFVLDRALLPAALRPWAMPAAVLLLILGVLPQLPFRRTTAVPVGAALVVGTLIAYVVIVAPSYQAAVADGAVGAATSPPATSSPVAPRPPRYPVVGVSTPTLADLDAFIRATGTHPEVFDVFEPWSNDRPLDRIVADGVRARGAQLSITWEPWVPRASDTSEHQPAWALRTILAGAHDRYIDLFAASVRDFGEPVTLRLMHEMNGTWYPWGTGVNGNRAGEFIEAWRYIHDRFAIAGATNVTWLWAPNAVYEGAAPLAPLYPGDEYVDAVGVSNYNWGDYERDGFATEWMSFGELFDESIAALRALTTRPVWITETGSSANGGSRAAWVTEMFADIRERPDVAGVIWFDHVDSGADVDWRVDQDAESVRSWRTGFWDRPPA